MGYVIVIAIGIGLVWNLVLEAREGSIIANLIIVLPIIGLVWFIISAIKSNAENKAKEAEEADRRKIEEMRREEERKRVAAEWARKREEKERIRTRLSGTLLRKLNGYIDSEIRKDMYNYAKGKCTFNYRISPEREMLRILTLCVTQDKVWSPQSVTFNFDFKKNGFAKLTATEVFVLFDLLATNAGLHKEANITENSRSLYLYTDWSYYRKIANEEIDRAYQEKVNEYLRIIDKR